MSKLLILCYAYLDVYNVSYTEVYFLEAGSF